MIRISNLAVALNDNVTLTEAAARRLNVSSAEITGVRVLKKALDARRYRGMPLQFIYSAAVELVEEKNPWPRSWQRDKNISPYWEPPPFRYPQFSGRRKNYRPIVIGFGPAGMFAALTLAKAGLEPLVLERGQDVDSRREIVARFWREGRLEENTNVQFGEGGAGTFSDGKLTSRNADPLTGIVLKELIAAGAPAETVYLCKPHLGTDLLPGIVKNIRREIIGLGGEIRFGAQVKNLEIEGKRLKTLILATGEKIPAETAFLAIGHSARDTYRMLLDCGVAMEAKAFAMGVRLEHGQEFIDRMQYGEDARHPLLPPADYALTYKAGKRGVYSFCMCPGGVVVAAASEAGGVVTNGMSRYARDSGLGNAAILAQVRPEDFGQSPLAGMELQRQCEKAAFGLAGGNYFAPAQTVGDFLQGSCGSADFLTPPSYLPGVKTADLRKCLPPYVTEPLAEALAFWGRKILGFAAPTAVLTGVETRSSAPCRILRDKASYRAVNTCGLYPIGEGAGYAGGIMSSALDGMKAALAFLNQNSD